MLSTVPGMVISVISLPVGQTISFVLPLLYKIPYESEENAVLSAETDIFLSFRELRKA